ncbi:anaphase-promoting complex, cyclosome, subunit 3 (macronuclear) [Tetrahymena thermophila SB210]|uniref:Anaphase-promoting complex, cyclosome, subunit 3 n=1 Tax=Tetrahymena thermophila (strain SB210) TaxID=312017 RepID=I7LWC8_TETTS|nr:anaphase-promoting complex, cyclosome, subunit 3 [Tetrahymena thermophila SB210]EAS01390.2 anaphase-promoting complex, cyclosome, subunit 3 [Tetrahymena thermophila SB210]|eukprot:XP_001021636.2 anaphase-promoting complex, cyclosome, subunit 3 [Tetrahymena thermophila SB210]
MNSSINFIKYEQGSSIQQLFNVQKEYSIAQKININIQNDQSLISYDDLQNQIENFFEDQQKNLLQNQKSQNNDHFQNTLNQFQLAQVQYVLKNYEASLQTYNRKVEEESVTYDQKVKVYNQGITLVQLGRFQEAIQCFDSIIDSQDIEENLKAATFNAKIIAYIKQEEFGQAIHIINKINCIEPLSIYLKIFFLIQQQKYQQAIDYFESIQIEIQRDNVVYAQTQNAIGIAHIFLNQIYQAARSFENAMKTDDKEYIYKTNLIQCKLKLSSDRQTYEECLSLAQESKQQEGKQSIEMFFLCGKLNQKLNNNDEALKNFYFAQKLLDNSNDQYQINSKSYRDQVQSIRLLQIIQIKLYILFTCKTIYIQSNDASIKQQIFKEFLQTFDQAKQIFSENKNSNHKENIEIYQHYFYSMISLLYLDKQNYENASKNIEEAIIQIQNQPQQNQKLKDNFELYNLIAGYANFQLANYQKAINFLEIINKSEYQQLKLYYRSEICIKTEDYTQAIKLLEQIVTSDPLINLRKKILLGIAHIMLDDFQKAWNLLIPLKKEILNKIEYNQFVKDSQLRHYLSVLYFKANLFNKALKTILKDYQQENNNYKRQIILLAYCYAQVGDDQQAYQQLLKLLKKLQDTKNEREGQEDIQSLRENEEDFQALIFLADFLYQYLKKEKQSEINCDYIYKLAAQLNQDALYYQGLYLSQINKPQISNQCLRQYLDQPQSSTRYILVQHIIALNSFFSLDLKSLNQSIYESRQFGFNNFLDLHNYYTNSIDQSLFRKLFVLFDLIKKKYIQQDQSFNPSFQEPFILFNVLLEGKQSINILLNEFELAFELFQLFKLKNNQQSITFFQDQNVPYIGIQNSGDDQIQRILNFMYMKKVNLGEIYIQFLMNVFPYSYIHQIFLYYQRLNSILLQNENSKGSKDILEANRCFIMLCLRILQTIDLLYKLKIPNLKFQWIQVLLQYNFWIQEHQKINLKQLQENKKNVYYFLNIISNCQERDIYSVICFMQELIDSQHINPSQTLKEFCYSATQSTYQLSYCQRFMTYLQIELFSYQQIKLNNQIQNISLADQIVKKFVSVYLKYQTNIQFDLQQDFKNSFSQISQKLNLDLQLEYSLSDYITPSFTIFLKDISNEAQQIQINEAIRKREQLDEEYFEKFIQMESQFFKDNQMNDWREVYISYLFKNKKLFLNIQNMMKSQNTNQKVQSLIYSILIIYINHHPDKERLLKFLDSLVQDQELKPIISNRTALDPKIFKKLLQEFDQNDQDFAKMQFERQFEIIYRYRFKYTDEEKARNIYQQVMEKLNNQKN